MTSRRGFIGGLLGLVGLGRWAMREEPPPFAITVDDPFYIREPGETRVTYRITDIDNDTRTITFGGPVPSLAPTGDDIQRYGFRRIGGRDTRKNWP